MRPPISQRLHARLCGCSLCALHHTLSPRWAVTDAYASGFTTPTRDRVQDVRLRGMTYSACSRTWAATLSRKLKTCDLDRDMVIEPGRGFSVMWACGRAFGNGFSGVSYHGTTTRGSAALQLVDEPVKAKADDTVEEVAAAASVQAPQELPPAKLAALAESLRQQLPLHVTKQRCSPDGKGGGGQCTLAVPSGDEVAAAATAAADEPSYIPKVIDAGDGTFYMDAVCGGPIPDVETTYVSCYVRMPADE